MCVYTHKHICIDIHTYIWGNNSKHASSSFINYLSGKVKMSPFTEYEVSRTLFKLSQRDTLYLLIYLIFTYLYNIYNMFTEFWYI